MDPITGSSLKMVNQLVYLFFCSFFFVFLFFFFLGGGGVGVRVGHVRSRRSLEHEFKRLV